MTRHGLPGRSSHPNPRRSQHDPPGLPLRALEVIAHRGAAARAPENTLGAVELALRSGVDSIEVDVRFSRDGVPLVIHDPALDRTTSGQGMVSLLSAEEIGRLDAGSWYHPAFGDLKVPALAQVLELLRSSTTDLLIEIKGARGLRAGWSEAVLALIRKWDMADRVIVESSRPAILGEIHRRDPGIRTGLVIRNRPAFYLLRIIGWLGLRPKVALENLALRHTLVTRRRVEAAHRQACRVLAWTVNSVEILHEMMAHGVDGVITDDPATILVALGRGDSVGY